MVDITIARQKKQYYQSAAIDLFKEMEKVGNDLALLKVRTRKDGVTAPDYTDMVNEAIRLDVEVCELEHKSNESALYAMAWGYMEEGLLDAAAARRALAEAERIGFWTAEEVEEHLGL